MPMTQKQNSLYWRLWSRACAAQGWTRAKGFASEQINTLRHQAHQDALGEHKSSTAFNNGDFDLIKAQFELLINDTDVSAAIRLANPEVGERKRLKFRIERSAPEAYRKRVSRDKFGKDDPDDLTLSELNQLRNTLAVRSRRNRNLTPDIPTDNQPF